ncbi:MAG: RNA pyrophosphohydrolase [Hyphomicrobium sp.]
MKFETSLEQSHSLTLPYKIGVGIVVFNRKGQVWTGRRQPKWAAENSSFIWQMPQGGLLQNEDPLDAAYRELEEETGISNVEVLAEIGHWMSYDLPPDLMGIALKGRYSGQRQKWFAMRFWGDDSEIDIGPKNGRKAEFDRWKWRAIQELPEIAIPYKKDMYTEIARVFGRFATP